ncbi:hypothetical protein FNJ84_14090 [Paracoccus sp. M683]|uniref:hypothetical protein n=1 Tax=Paracoccus sp. M683 TaxID=2594268 RepID=UPI00117E0A3C|nr:hypothetical protein [Paracoccus sp. M683]TRW95973.1 hypothetical protein FNJ84_14090 [Paracoccus sp. M683]
MENYPLAPLRLPAAGLALLSFFNSDDNTDSATPTPPDHADDQMGATGLTIAFQVFDSTIPGHTDYVDANGEPIDPPTADVTLRGFYRIVN